MTMLTKEKLIRNTSYDLTFSTNKKVVDKPLVEFDKPFWGADEKAYIMAKYPERLMHTTNCYSFALGWRIAGKPSEDFKPGFLSGLPYSFENLAKLVESDLAVVGRKVYETMYEIPEELPSSAEGYWIKAVKIGESDTDIHFMVKDTKSGRWFHKVGWERPPKIVTRNLDLVSDVDYAMSLPEYQNFPREAIEQMILMMFGRIRKNIVSCVIETQDNAEYRLFNPEKNPDDYIICQNLFAMKISK